jgi:hypothetical protein
VNTAATQQKTVGVYLHRPKDAAHLWVGRIWIKGKCSQVPGRYQTAIEAHNARCDHMAKLGLPVPAKIVAGGL